jgi:hypothetical protein
MSKEFTLEELFIEMITMIKMNQKQTKSIDEARAKLYRIPYNMDSIRIMK